MAVLAPAVMPRITRLARFALTILILCVSQQVVAATSPSPDNLLTVSKSGAGTVTSVPGGIDCGTTCSAAYSSGTYVTLQTAAAGGNSFLGWSGACRGKKPSCRVSMKGARSVGATFTQNSTTNVTTSYSLNVAVSGSGTITSSPAGISCGATCSATYASGTSVTLTAAAASGYSFAGWSGVCTGTSTSCVVSMTAARSVAATFTQNIVSYSLSVAKSGSGTVTSSPAGINCGTSCSASYASGTSVTLTATAASGYSFAGWSGACTGTSTSCVVSMTAARSVTASFTQNVVNYSLTVSKSGFGTVTSSPSGINCGTVCSASYASVTSVALTATAASGYSFSGWSGACSGTSATCTVSMTAARSVTATFNQVISNATTLAWDPPAASANPAGYRLYFGSASGTYQQPYGQGISVGNITTYTLMGLSSGTYYFAVTAVDSLGKESAYSNEAFKNIP